MRTVGFFSDTIVLLVRTKGGVILMVTFGLTLALNLFGTFKLSERGDAINTEVIGAFYGPIYGGERLGQKNIAVILINQDTLDALHASRWPPDYGDQADIIEWIAAYRPTAIFLDLYYQHGRAPAAEADPAAAFSGLMNDGQTPPSPAAPVAAKSGNDSLADLGRRLKGVEAAGTPLFIGPVNMADPTLEPLYSPKGERLQQVGIGLKEWPRDAYPVASGGHPQAAFALYNEWCKARHVACPDAAKRLDGHDLVIQWGFGVSDAMAHMLPATERKFCQGATISQRVAAVGRIIKTHVFPSSGLEGDSMEAYSRCPYFDTFPAHWLQAPPKDFDAASLIRDRIVLVGADLPFLADFVEAPLLGHVPGVMAHAMALDNLISAKGHVAHHPGNFVMNMTYRDLVEMLLELCGLAGMLFVHWLFKTQHPEARRYHRSWWLAQIAVAALVPAAIGLFISNVFAWSAVNIVYVAGIGLWSLFLMSREFSEMLEAEHPVHREKEKIDGHSQEAPHLGAHLPRPSSAGGDAA